MVSPLARKFLTFLAISYQLSAISCYAQQPKYIRVAVMQEVSSFRLKISGRYEALEMLSERSVSRGKHLNTAVTAYGKGILLGKLNCPGARIMIKPERYGDITINGRRFRGSVEIIRNGPARLSVINHIALEDYVKGILYHEVSHYWPPQALEAQAIVCRSYAVYQAQDAKNRDYDVTSDVYSQVYGGKTSERYRTNLAVDRTQGKVLLFQGKVLPAYFHATCGGHTEDVGRLWNTKLAPLSGVSCDFCKESPHFNWHSVLSLKEIEKKLKLSGRSTQEINNISVLGRDESGRITELGIGYIDGESKISAKDFRNMIGPNIIRSTNFGVSIAGNEAVFVGLGWGHGVGLCQWGAYFMAKSGKTSDEILAYYYPGSEISLLAK